MSRTVQQYREEDWIVLKTKQLQAAVDTQQKTNPIASLEFPSLWAVLLIYLCFFLFNFVLILQVLSKYIRASAFFCGIHEGANISFTFSWALFLVFLLYYSNVCFCFILLILLFYYQFLEVSLFSNRRHKRMSTRDERGN